MDDILKQLLHEEQELQFISVQRRDSLETWQSDG